MAGWKGGGDWRGSKLLSGARAIQAQYEGIKDDLKNFGKSPADLPQFLTGARAYISIGGKPYAIAQRVSYRIQANVEDVRTIDTPFPWELSVGQIYVHASLQGLIDPTRPAETESTWSNMASIIHQPLVTLEIFDKLGEKQFTSNGMFVSLTNSIGMGSAADRSVEFIGIMYAHNVEQKFTPYAQQNPVAAALSTAANTLKKYTGGLF